MAPYIPVATEGFLNFGSEVGGGFAVGVKTAALIASLVGKSIETVFGAAATAATLSQHGLRVIDDTCCMLKSNTCLFPNGRGY